MEEVTAKLTVEEKIGIMSGQETEQKLLDDLFDISQPIYDPGIHESHLFQTEPSPY